jgi:hypothetical protein
MTVAASSVSLDGFVEFLLSVSLPEVSLSVLVSFFDVDVTQLSNLFFCRPALSLVLMASSCFFVGAGSCIFV